MIFNTARLPQCTIGNVKCFYKESTVSGGRKTVTHEYPDTNTRYVEDLGKLEKTYNIEVVVNTNTSFSDRDKLIKILEQGGLISLVHPAFGKKQVALKSYSLSDNTTSLGICAFSLVLEEASLNKMPLDTKGNKGFLASLKSKILGDSETAFNNAWDSVVKAKEKFDSANSTLSNTANEMKRVSQLINGSVDSFSDFTTSINEIIDSTGSLIQTPSVLSSKIKTSFNNLSVAYNKSEDLFNVLTNFFGYNGSDRVATGNSATQKSIANNQSQIQNIFQANALALAYNAAVNIDYATQDQLNLIISKLEDGFDKLPTIDRDLLRTIQQMRIESMAIFSNLAISLPKLIEFETKPVSLNVLVYSLYGSLANKELIKNLNQLSDTTRVSGKIKILSNV